MTVGLLYLIQRTVRAEIKITQYVVEPYRTSNEIKITQYVVQPYRIGNEIKITLYVVEPNRIGNEMKIRSMLYSLTG